MKNLYSCYNTMNDNEKQMFEEFRKGVLNYLHNNPVTITPEEFQEERVRIMNSDTTRTTTTVSNDKPQQVLGSLPIQ